MADRTSFAQFTTLARRVGDQARGLGLAPPAFRTPPRVPGADRTLRRRADGGAVVSVRVEGRGAAAVVGDLVEGVVAANGLAGEAAERAREALLAGVPSGGGSPRCAA